MHSNLTGTSFWCSSTTLNQEYLSKVLKSKIAKLKYLKHHYYKGEPYLMAPSLSSITLLFTTIRSAFILPTKQIKNNDRLNITARKYLKNNVEVSGNFQEKFLAWGHTIKIVHA